MLETDRGVIVPQYLYDNVKNGKNTVGSNEADVGELVTIMKSAADVVWSWTKGEKLKLNVVFTLHHLLSGLTEAPINTLGWTWLELVLALHKSMCDTPATMTSRLLPTFNSLHVWYQAANWMIGMFEQMFYDWYNNPEYRNF
jgi:hypothetical protein